MWSTTADRERAALEKDPDYFRPGGIAIDALNAAKAKDTDGYPYGVHVVLEDGRPAEVWLNTENSDFDGICIGTGSQAVADAVQTLERTLEILQAPPTPDVYRPRE